MDSDTRCVNDATRGHRFLILYITRCVNDTTRGHRFLIYCRWDNPSSSNPTLRCMWSVYHRTNTILCSNSNSASSLVDFCRNRLMLFRCAHDADANTMLFSCGISFAVSCPPLGRFYDQPQCPAPDSEGVEGVLIPSRFINFAASVKSSFGCGASVINPNICS